MAENAQTDRRHRLVRLTLTNIEEANFFVIIRLFNIDV